MNHIPYFDREMSQLAFNERVLALAFDESIPLLNRLRYLFIVSRNLDEFFEIRVANLKHQLFLEPSAETPHAITLNQELKTIQTKASQLINQLFACYNHSIYPALNKAGIYFLKQHEWSSAQRQWVRQYFREQIFPLVSPLALDAAHPFPKLLNKNLNFIVALEGIDAFGREGHYAIVHVPRSIPRLILVPEQLKKTNTQAFFLLSSIIKAEINQLFPGMKIKGCYQFRIVRNSDLILDEKEIIDLPLALKTSLMDRRFGLAVRLDLEIDCPDYLADFLLNQHQLSQEDLFRIEGQVNFYRLSAVFDWLHQPDLFYPPLTPSVPGIWLRANHYFDLLKTRDILLYHPYESFEPVVNFVRQASIDTQVVAIKQTLYRTNADSAIVDALVVAARAGIEVTAIIELRARFDEEHNISLARRLQEAGAIVVYGIVGYKTHAKMMLIIRREGGKLCRYAHLGTGNYHEKTAQEYSDLSLLTSHPLITKDMLYLFQELMGTGKSVTTKKLWHAPFTLAKQLKLAIETEMKIAQAGYPAFIYLKLNGLTDALIIDSLYVASQAGVKIRLFVRGMCTLIPQKPGLSDNIQVYSIVGRFLEHARVYYFHNKGREKVYCASADLMERNLYHRFEIAFPILDKTIARRIIEECFTLAEKDKQDCWELDNQGVYHLRQAENKSLSMQAELIEKYKVTTQPL